MCLPNTNNESDDYDDEILDQENEIIVNQKLKNVQESDEEYMEAMMAENLKLRE